MADLSMTTDNTTLHVDSLSSSEFIALELLKLRVNKSTSYWTANEILDTYKYMLEGLKEDKE